MTIISGCHKMVHAFSRGEQATDVPDDLPEVVVRPCDDPAQQRPELRERHLDRAGVRAVPRQELNRVPTLSGISVAFALPLAARSSRMTISPSRSVGARKSSAQRPKVFTSIAPSVMPGAWIPSWRRTAMNVCVFRCPAAAWSTGARRPDPGRWS